MAVRDAAAETPLLRRLGFAAEDALLAVVAAIGGVEFVAVRGRTVPPEILRRLPEAVIRSRRILPLEVLAGDRRGTLSVAMADPFDLLAVDDLASAAGMPVRPVLAAGRALDEAIARHLDRGASPGDRGASPGER